MTEPFLRLFAFRPGTPDSVVDARLRDAAREARSADGLRHLYLGRRGTDAEGVRVVASVWDGTRAVDTITRGHPLGELLPDATDTALSDARLPLVFAVEAHDDRQLTVLRVFHGSVHPGGLEAYVAEAEAGVQADIDAGYGPAAFFLGTEGGDRFTTVSAWTSWDAIERATGGNIRDPFATRFSTRLVEWTVDHYEMVGAVEPEPRPPLVPR